jgi:hypothetical protein
LGFDEEDDRLDYSGDLEEERRRNIRLDGHIRAHGFSGTSFRGSLCVQHSQIGGLLAVLLIAAFFSNS